MTKAAPKAGAKAGSKAGAGKFAKGVSGNPAGMKRGTKHRRTLLLAAMTDDDRSAIVEKIIRQAKRGDRASQRLIVDRIEPPRKGRVAIAWGPIKTAADAIAALQVISDAVGRAQISPAEASELTNVINSTLEAIRTHEIKRQLEAMERQVGS